MKVIKIGAIWCSGCLVMRPRWQEIEKQNLWLEVKYYDYDQDREKIKEFNISPDRLPVFIFLDKKGKKIEELSGELSKKEIQNILEKYKDR